MKISSCILNLALFRTGLSFAPNLGLRKVLASSRPSSADHYPDAFFHKTKQVQQQASSSESWGIDDDWEELSANNPKNCFDLSSILNVDPTVEAARRMSQEWKGQENDLPAAVDHGRGEQLENEIIDSIYSPVTSQDAPALYDTKESFDNYAKSVHFLDDMGREISLLVRCNEEPENLLVSLGRKLPVLPDEERYDKKQLVLQKRDGGLELSDFFVSAIQTMFHMHASSSDTNERTDRVLTTSGIASWMSKSLGENVGSYDRRVSIVLGKYSTHGSGVLTMSQFEQLYRDAANKSVQNEAMSSQVHSSVGRKQEHRPTFADIWRDIENHDLQPPVVEERKLLQKNIDEKYGTRKEMMSSTVGLVDECEILEWQENEHSTPRTNRDGQRNGASSFTRRSSHKLVQLASDGETPGRLRDGDFVFIDEESCIGCKQCVKVAPASFQMLENGRARTFEQSNMSEVDTAVSICPVGCMHKVSFDELKEMETARDEIDSQSNRRDKGTVYNQHIPLNVARIDSDANRRSSWYHSLKHKCFTSKSCPQRGCYDCPMYDTPGSNPYFKQRHRHAEHVRAMDIVRSGEADSFRKTADL
jgi:ferredoxin